MERVGWFSLVMLVALCCQCMTAQLCLPGSMSPAEELRADRHNTVQFKHNLGRENK